MAKVGTFKKFYLLLWKNWKIQSHHICQLIAELLVPLIFAALVILLRVLLFPENVPEAHFAEQNIDMSTYNRYMISAHRMNSVISRILAKSSQRIEKEQPRDHPRPYLYYAPENKILGDIVDETVKLLNFNGSKGFKDEQSMVDEVMRENAFAGILFGSSLKDIETLPDTFDFTLRFPSEFRTRTQFLFGIESWSTNRLFPAFTSVGPRNPMDHDGGVPSGYLCEGFLPIQHGLSMNYLRHRSNTSDLPNVVLQRYPYPEYRADVIVTLLGGIIPIFIVFSYIYSCACITGHVTKEKELQLKEVMKIQGLSNWLHWAAWYVKSFCILAVATILLLISWKIKWRFGVSVFTFADFFVILLFFLVYISTAVWFCFMLATFFSKASKAAAVAGLLWFVTYLPYAYMAKNLATIPLVYKLLSSLLINTALGMGINIIMQYESEAVGAQWENLFLPPTIDANLSLGMVIVMMLVSTLLYMLICLYVEQIYPGSYGVPRKWYFPVTRQFWCNENPDQDREPGGSENRELKHREPKSREPDPTNKRPGIIIKELRKRYGDKVVVKNISINMFEDEITVLLGHNGAGKTTTISMLTGMIPPTSGTAIINGYDIRTNLSAARSSLGICPQHNVLFEDLSVADHLYFFSRIKGVKRKAVKYEIDKYLNILNLKDKAKKAAKKLSGGMKRKLALCCALCGDTKVVLCDEPSSGLDPAARRQLWDLLLQEKEGRTILLTTHFMDEADVLGDRIAIMHQGEIQCHGTSFFLKKNFGSGYKLICVKLEKCDSRKVTEMLKQFIPSLEIANEIGTELTYILPDKYSNHFEKMLIALEDNSNKLKIGGFGLSASSIEDVFMKVGAEHLDTNDKPRSSAGAEKKDQMTETDRKLTYKKVETDKRNETNKKDEVDKKDETDKKDEMDAEANKHENSSNDGAKMRGCRLMVNQWKAMLYKKLLYAWRNKFMHILQLLLGIFFVWMTVAVSRSSFRLRPQPAMTMSISQYPSVVTVMERPSTLSSDSINYKFADQYEQLVKSEGSKYESTGDESFSTYILNRGKTIQSRIDSKYLLAATFGENITAWLNNEPYHTAPLTVNTVHNAMARQLIGEKSEIRVTNHPLPFRTETTVNELTSSTTLGTQLATFLCFCMAFISAMYILAIIKERGSGAKLLQYVGGVRGLTYWLSHFLWDLLTFTITAMVIVITIACFQEEHLQTFDVLIHYFILLFLFGCSMLPFTYLCAFMFTDPSNGFTRYTIMNIILGISIPMVVQVLSATLTAQQHIADIITWTLLLYPHFSLGIGLEQLYMVAALRGNCAKLDGLPSIILCEVLPQCCNPANYYDWDHPGILTVVVFLVLGFILFFVLIVWIDGGFSEFSSCMSSSGGKTKVTPLKKQPIEKIVDDDVASERERIAELSPAERANISLVVDRLSKYYSNFLAVNQLAFCVNERECFGLLGINGAGKTTTFKMLTGDVRIKSGNAYVLGMSMISQKHKILKKIGYCPQFDALLDFLTGRETLKIFGLLRGLSANDVKKETDELGKALGFSHHLNKLAMKYSGGTKRKLSTAIAMMGSPSIIYLDEPTSGMDPAARRQLWNVICGVRDRGKAIVLTTHSMEECEALCTRLGIMVRGELKCIGSSQHLKNKFSKGFVLKIKVRSLSPKESNLSDGRETPIPYATSSIILGLNNPSEGTSSAANVASGHSRKRSSIRDAISEQDLSRVKIFIQTNLPHAQLHDQYQSMLTYYVPLNVKWSFIFGLIERNKNKLNIDDYSINQTSLEEIFLQLADTPNEDANPDK